MFGKPNYCCNCGDKVERIEWHVWNSRRFCELCETQFQFDEWWPRGALFLVLVLGITGIGFHFGEEKVAPISETGSFSRPQKLKSASSQRVGVSADGNSRDQSENLSPEIPPDAPPTPVAVRPRKEVYEPKREAAVKEEPVFYCGALTKKGTPCSRKVKSEGEHCWQHKDAETNKGGSRETK
ncbi:MAG: hypothetical protein R2684_16245 [Pyrinomonadaceae bacterium]